MKVYKLNIVHADIEKKEKRDHKFDRNEITECVEDIGETIIVKVKEKPFGRLMKNPFKEDAREVVTNLKVPILYTQIEFINDFVSGYNLIGLDPNIKYYGALYESENLMKPELSRDRVTTWGYESVSYHEVKKYLEEHQGSEWYDKMLEMFNPKEIKRNIERQNRREAREKEKSIIKLIKRPRCSVLLKDNDN